MVYEKRFLILFFLFLIQLSFVFSADVTGNVVTSPFSISIVVVSDLASISIVTPENKTYFINESLNLTYLVGNEDAVWYNIDNSVNTTITGSVLFNVSSGQHTLYLYANSSLGNVSVDNVTFYANSSLFTIIYDGYRGGTRGSSTRFRQIAFEDLQNISGIVLENSNFGKIVFNDYVNVTGDDNVSDNVLDLDSNTEISSNLIVLDSTALPNFNVSSTLSLYNLNFTDPQILLDGAVCPSSICTELNYSGLTLMFNVTRFSSYSSRETPGGGDDSSPGGGGGSSVSSWDLFNVSVSTLGVSIKQGGIVTKKISVTNLGSRKLNFEIEPQGFGDMIIVRPIKFSLEPKKSKEISLDFIAREDQIPEIYIGKLIFKAGGKTEEVLVFLEVESKQELFDVDIEIPRDYLNVLAGEYLIVEIELFNMGDTGRIDFDIEYFIRDANGENIVYHRDTRSIETMISFIEKFMLPENVKPGQYVLYVRVSYDGKVASSSAWFSVVEESSFLLNNGIYVLIVLLIIFIAIIVVIILWNRRKVREEGYGKF